MRFYIAAKFDRKEEVRRIYQLLEGLGHEITADWTLHKPIKPYKENTLLAKEYSIEDIRGVKDSDVFLLLSGEGGTGTFVELGAAISSNISTGKPEIYVIGEKNKESLFCFHPSVHRMDSLDEVLAALGITGQQ